MDIHRILIIARQTVCAQICTYDAYVSYSIVTEYGIVGEVMFWTLGKVLGQAYTAEAHYS
jgi:hypothetical protein